MAFFSLFKPTDRKPQTQLLSSKGNLSVLFRDQFSIGGWLEIGACLNVAIILAARPFIGKYALLLPFIAMSLRLGRTLLTAAGFLHNPYMDGVVMNKYSAQIPNDDGTFGPKPASKQITVFLIGARCNHPLGIFAPGFKETGDYMQKMQKELNGDAAKYGLLGSSSWIETGRTTQNEQLFVMYFNSADDIHDYAHGPLHREAWTWWNKTIAKHKHIAIWHEIFVAPKGHWESIYVNAKPTLMGATTYPIKTAEGLKWFSPIVDARKGPLKSSRGRMTLTDGKDNDHIDDDPYENWGRLEAQ